MVMLQASSLAHPSRPRALMLWLFAVAALIVLMVVVGGITRLTESGLSITEWKPISGIIPPLTEAQWQAEFDQYKRIPQYTEINRGMTLAGFKGIFFWEYRPPPARAADRPGLCAAAAVVLGARGAIPPGYGGRLLATSRAGRPAGRDRLVDGRLRPVGAHRCQPYPLAIHLITALVLLVGMIWTALDLRLLLTNRLAAARPAAPDRRHCAAPAVHPDHVRRLHGRAAMRDMPFQAGR